LLLLFSMLVAPAAPAAVGVPRMPLPVSRRRTCRMDAASRDLELEMAWCARVVRDAADVLRDGDQRSAIQLLDFEMSQERLGMGPARSAQGGQMWVRHIDEHIVSMCLVDDADGAVISAVCRPATDELLCAARGAGAFMQIGDEPATPAPEVGCASMSATVVHVPYIKCPEIDLAIEALEEKMPCEVTRVPCCCCCEGLFELVSGRADVHVSPPAHCLSSPSTPVAVLCAFEVLLDEGGGYMSDVMGDEIDLVAAMRSGTHTSGVLASGFATHGYMLHATRPPFQAERLLLPRLADTLQREAVGFRIELVSERRMVPEVSLLERAFKLPSHEDGPGDAGARGT